MNLDLPIAETRPVFLALLDLSSSLINIGLPLFTMVWPGLTVFDPNAVLMPRFGRTQSHPTAIVFFTAKELLDLIGSIIAAVKPAAFYRKDPLGQVIKLSDAAVQALATLQERGPAEAFQHTQRKLSHLDFDRSQQGAARLVSWLRSLPAVLVGIFNIGGGPCTR